MLNLEPLNPRFIDGQHTGEDDAAHYTTDEESDLYSGRARNVVDDTLDQTSSDESEPDSPEPREFVPETPLPLRLPTTLRSSSPGRDWEDEPVSRAQKRPSADRWSSDDDSDKENRPPKRRSVAKKLSKYFRQFIVVNDFYLFFAVVFQLNAVVFQQFFVIIQQFRISNKINKKQNLLHFFLS